MNILILSGGSGKRLWPLSNEVRSKQFLKLLKNDSGERESMLQRIFRQIKEAGIHAHIVVATSDGQRDSIVSQLGQKVDIVLEPERRDTFPAIVLASAFMSYEKNMSSDQVVIVLPVDPYADSEYFETLIKMETLIANGMANIVLMGIKPTYPSGKYGYIIPKKEGILVERFQEKPSEECAEKLIENGAMWNGGVFAFRLGYLLETARKYIPFSSYAEVENQYQNLPKISFDYEVVEKEESIAVLEYSGEWRDLGTWNTLTEVMDDNTIGQVILADTCENTHVINELNIPVTVLGTKNLVVAASPDGILVSDKHQSSCLKRYVDDINQRPMHGEQAWGYYQVLNYSAQSDGDATLIKNMVVYSKQSLKYRFHVLRDLIFMVVDGTGKVVLESEVSNIKRGDVIHIDRGHKYSIYADTDLSLIEVQIGKDLSDNDMVLCDWEWD